MDKPSPSSSPGFNKAAPGDPRPIFQTEAGRIMAQAIEQKADAVERKWTRRLSENREAWVATRAAKIAAERDKQDRDFTMRGAKTQTPEQQAIQQHMKLRETLAKRVAMAKNNMLARAQEPSRNTPTREAKLDAALSASKTQQPTKERSSKLRAAFDKSNSR